MRRYLIDTTPLSALVSNPPPAVALITPWMHQHEAATSILVYGEVLEGLQGRPNPPNGTATCSRCSGKSPPTSSLTRSCSATPRCAVSCVRPTAPV